MTNETIKNIYANYDWKTLNAYAYANQYHPLYNPFYVPSRQMIAAMNVERYLRNKFTDVIEIYPF